MTNALTIDVEDWFHILDLENGYRIEEYDKLESRIERNTEILLSILGEYHVKGTFFVVGWIADRYPHLVNEIDDQGHEVASHGYAHALSHEMDLEEFRKDVKKSVDILEQIMKNKVLGYRAPGGSISEDNLWVFDALLELGILYDASVYPGNAAYGGISHASRFPYRQKTPKGNEILEIPFSCFQWLGKSVAFAGGGYLRLFPYWLIKRGMNEYSRQGHPVTVYIHPREIDPSHPKMQMPLYRRFKCYINLHTTENKLRALLRDYQFGRIKDIFNLE